MKWVKKLAAGALAAALSLTLLCGCRGGTEGASIKWTESTTHIAPLSTADVTNGDLRYYIISDSGFTYVGASGTKDAILAYSKASSSAITDATGAVVSPGLYAATFNSEDDSSGTYSALKPGDAVSPSCAIALLIDRIYTDPPESITWIPKKKDGTLYYTEQVDHEFGGVKVSGTFYYSNGDTSNDSLRFIDITYSSAVGSTAQRTLEVAYHPVGDAGMFRANHSFSGLQPQQ